MLTAPWVRNWLYHAHPLSGVAGVRLVLLGDPGVLTYSHGITAAADAPSFLIVCMVFPLIALGLGALSLWGYDAAGQDDPPRGGDGPTVSLHRVTSRPGVSRGTRKLLVPSSSPADGSVLAYTTYRLAS